MSAKPSTRRITLDFVTAGLFMVSSILFFLADNMMFGFSFLLLSIAFFIIALNENKNTPNDHSESNENNQSGQQTKAEED